MAIQFDRHFTVYHFECDPWRRMTPGAVLRRAQEIATAQCEDIGIDDAFYARTGTAFFLSKISLEYYRAPMLGEQVRMQTRPYGMRKALYHRVTTMYSEAGEKLCEVDSRWVLVDVASRHILRKPREEFAPYFSEEPAEEHDMPKIKPEGEPQPLAGMRAAYTLCDTNMHVNNTRYADFVCDHLPMACLEKAMPKKLVFNYHNEIPIGEEFALYGAEGAGGGHYFLAQSGQVKNFEALVMF